jgi:hypothetical protein
MKWVQQVELLKAERNLKDWKRNRVEMMNEQFHRPYNSYLLGPYTFNSSVGPIVVQLTPDKQRMNHNILQEIGSQLAMQRRLK